jgi:hypothetical protein
MTRYEDPLWRLCRVAYCGVEPTPMQFAAWLTRERREYARHAGLLRVAGARPSFTAWLHGWMR